MGVAEVNNIKKSHLYPDSLKVITAASTNNHFQVCFQCLKNFVKDSKWDIHNIFWDIAN